MYVAARRRQQLLMQRALRPEIDSSFAIASSRANRTEPDDMDGSLSCSMENLFPVNNEETGQAATRN
jgi:hypothetical protein